MDNITKALEDVQVNDTQVKEYGRLQRATNIYLSSGGGLIKLDHEEQTELNKLLGKFIDKRNTDVAETRKYLEAVNGLLGLGVSGNNTATTAYVAPTPAPMPPPAQAPQAPMMPQEYHQKSF